MGDQFADLARLDAVVERAADMAADLRGLAGGNQRGDGDEAAVPSGKLRATLDVAEEHVIGKMAEARRDIVDGGRRDTGAPVFLGCDAGGGEGRKGDGGGDGLQGNLLSI